MDLSQAESTLIKGSSKFGYIGTYLVDDGRTRFPGYRGLGVPSWQLWARHRVNEVRSGSQLSRGIGSLLGAGLSLHALWVLRPASRAPARVAGGAYPLRPTPLPPYPPPLSPLPPPLTDLEKRVFLAGRQVPSIYHVTITKGIQARARRPVSGCDRGAPNMWPPLCSDRCRQPSPEDITATARGHPSITHSLPILNLHAIRPWH